MRCTLLFAVLLLAATTPEHASAQVSASDAVIAAATKPLPPQYRDSAEVRVYDGEGRLVTARQGFNEMICLADEPGDDRFHVACYHSSLEPFMERGRELRAEGLGRDDVERVREEEATSGALRMPDRPAALYSLTGPSEAFDTASGDVTGATALHVIYMPWATAEQTGLPTAAPKGMPWIMNPGKPWAHIMLLPQPAPDEE